MCSCLGNTTQHNSNTLGHVAPVPCQVSNMAQKWLCGSDNQCCAVQYPLTTVLTSHKEASSMPLAKTSASDCLLYSDLMLIQIVSPDSFLKEIWHIAPAPILSCLPVFSSEPACRKCCQPCHKRNSNNK